MSQDFSSLSPFPTDPSVLAKIRPMTLKDCEAVARLHHADMGKSLWAQLGIRFLAALYRELLNNHGFIAYVYDDQGHIGGFIAGTTDSSNLFRTVLLSGWTRLIGPLLLGILRRPQLVFKLLFTSSYFSRSRAEDDSVNAESLFCSFVPELRGKRVSGHINKVFFEHLLHLGIPKVKITTETDNPGSNRQLRSWGFREAKRFEFYGKPMVTYILELRGHPRLNQQAPTIQTDE